MNNTTPSTTDESPSNDFDVLIESKLDTGEDIEAVFTELDAAYDRLDKRLRDHRSEQKPDLRDTEDVASADELIQKLGSETVAVFGTPDRAHVSVIRVDPSPEFRAHIRMGDDSEISNYDASTEDIRMWVEEYPTAEIRDVRDNIHFDEEDAA